MSELIQSRTRNTFFNAITSTVGHGISVILGFVVRMVFLQYLAIELLGVNGLFTSILTVFSLAELGFSSAVAFALYKPLAEKDERKIAAYMRYYSITYAIIGIIILLIGITILPFLQHLIKNFEQINITLNDLRLYFSIFLISTTSTYFFAYKRTVIISDQKRYIVNIISIIISILSKLFQILLIIIFHNYLLFIAVNVIFVYTENIIISIIVDKKYKYLKLYKSEKLTIQDKKALYINISALFFNKISAVFTTGIISILISRLIGLKEAGLYSNYYLLTSAISTLLFKFTESATASVGNFAITENKEAQKALFKKILYFNSFFAVLFFSGLSILLNNFIEIWLGKEMILDNLLPIAMSVNLFLLLIRNTSWIFFNAFGLYRHHFYRCFLEVVLFLALAIPGAIFFGIIGIVVSRIISIIVMQFPFEIYIISKYALKEKSYFYLKYLLKYLFIALICFSISFIISNFILLSGLIGFISKTIIISLIVVSIYYLTTFKTEEYKYYLNIIKNIFFKLKQVKTNGTTNT